MFDSAYSVDLKAKVIVDEGEIIALMIFMPDGSSLSFALPNLKAMKDYNDQTFKEALEEKILNKESD
jgi:hypothetical protein